MIKITNSKSNTKVELNPLTKDSIRMYVCGPTVYDYSHIGHARSAISFDLLYRNLKENNYNVIFAKNFTDIDDKILNKLKTSNLSLKELTTIYMDAYNKDMEMLNVLKPTMEIKATDNIDNMINFIDKLIKNGSAYKLEDGIYFDTNSYPNYGTLFNRLSDDNREDVVKNINKKNERDFALWKFDKESSIIFDTPFGKGRPGWHTECSVMINEHLAYKDKEFQIDIHGGGEDLMFPHHENEEAQTFAYSGKKLAKYWMHNAFVTINGAKMSKSLGNSFYLKDILAKYNPEVVRFYLMSTHYKSNLAFNEVDLLDSKKRLDKLYRVIKKVNNVDLEDNKNHTNEFINLKDNIKEIMNNDLNTPEVMATLEYFISLSNTALDKDFKKYSKEIKYNLESLNSILGLGYQDPYKYFQFGLNKDKINFIENKINERNKAKLNKNYELSDNIRNELKELNVSLMDSKNGTLWEIIDNDEELTKVLDINL